MWWLYRCSRLAHRLGFLFYAEVSMVTEKAMALHSNTLAWKIHGLRSLKGCSPWSRWGSDRTKRLHFHFSLSFIGEGNGNPLHCSCLENPRDEGAWWVVVYVVAQSWTQLKWIRSSSTSSLLLRTSLFSASRGSSVIAVHWLFNPMHL